MLPLNFLGVPLGPSKMLTDSCRASLVKESLSIASRLAFSLWNLLHNVVEWLYRRDSVVRDLFVEAGYELSAFCTSLIQLLHIEIFPRKATVE
jgi:hypothetical protein